MTAVPSVMSMAYSNRDPEPNTGQRGMFAREYHQWTAERMAAEAERRSGTAPDHATPAPTQHAELDASAQPPALAPPVLQPSSSLQDGDGSSSDPTPLVTIYPRNQTGSLRLGNGVAVPCYTYPQLERMSAEGGPRVGIKLVASQLRDSIGEAQLAQCGLPPLNIHAHQEQIIDWVLKAQVVLARESGLTDVSEESFGVPRDDGRSGMNHSQRSAV